MIQWEEWLTELISDFREKYNSLSKDQRKYISNLDNFKFPCQVDVLWVKNKQLDSHYQVLFFTHFKDEPDLSFHIYETSDPYRFSEIAVKMLEESKWSKKLPRTESNRFMNKMFSYQTYHDYLVGALSNQCAMMKQYFNHLCMKTPIASRVDSPGKQALFNEFGSSMWDVRGDITTVNPKEIVDNIVKEAKLRPGITAQRRKQSVKENVQKSRKGFGALIFPRVWIGKLPEQSLRDKIERNYFFAKTIFNAQYKKSTIVLRQDGFIGIIFETQVEESEVRNKSLELLNEIIATCVILDLPFHAIRESDLVEITIEPNTFNITGMSWQPSSYESSSLQQQDIWGSVLPSSLTFERRMVKRATVCKAISKAEKLTASQATRNSLIFLLEAHTLYENSEYPQSFLSSWIIIENHIRGLWDKFLKEKKTDKRRVSKLFSPNYSDIDHILETLNLSNELATEKYALLMKLKKVRNDIVHSGEKASMKEAEECFQLASDITRKQCDVL